MEKRLLHSLVFSLCALFSMAQGRFCVGMLHYEVLSETGRVVHVYDTSFPWKESVSVDIPETVSYNGKNYTVIAIGANAFASRCSLQAIKIPNSVTKIGKYAFGGCDSLRSVQIPNSVTEIGANAFLGCHLLRTVRIPSSVALSIPSFVSTSTNVPVMSSPATYSFTGGQLGQVFLMKNS